MHLRHLRLSTFGHELADESLDLLRGMDVWIMDTRVRSYHSCKMVKCKLPSSVRVLIRAKRVSNCCIPKKKLRVCACARARVCSINIGFNGENTNLGFSVGYVLCASYICTWYQPADHSMVPGTCYIPQKKFARVRVCACARVFDLSWF